MGNTIGLKEFRAEVPKIIKRVGNGEAFVVIRRSKPVFKVSPVDADEQWETVIDFTRINKGGVPIEDIISAIANERHPKSHRQTLKRA